MTPSTTAACLPDDNLIKTDQDQSNLFVFAAVVAYPS